MYEQISGGLETTSYKLCLSSSCGLTQPHGVGERRFKMSFPPQGWLQAFHILSGPPWEGDLSPCHEASSLPHSRVAAHLGFTSASSCPQAESRDVLEDTDFFGGGSWGPRAWQARHESISSQMITIGPSSDINKRNRGRPSKMEGYASNGKEDSFASTRDPHNCLEFLVLAHH